MEESEVFGKYHLLGQVGRGSFATVYRAQDPTLGREVALKLLHAQLLTDAGFVARFLREAHALANLRHSHIVTVYEVGSVEGRIYIAMELARGTTLQALIAEQGGIPWAEALALLRPVCEALDYAHAQNVVHRDLKPSNILIDSERGPLLTDFGFARLMADSSQSMSMSGGILGTPGYIAPEVWELDAATPAADLYALGCIAFEMLTGKVLFAGATPMQAVRAHDRGPQFPESWPQGVPERLAGVLSVALARDPQHRYASAMAFWHALEGLETQAQAAREAAERARLAAQWRADAEAALAAGELGAARMAGGRWLKAAPEDGEALAFLDRVHAATQEAEEQKRREAERAAREEAALAQKEADERARPDAQERAAREQEIARREAQERVRREAEERTARQQAVGPQEVQQEAEGALGAGPHEAHHAAVVTEGPGPHETPKVTAQREPLLQARMQATKRRGVPLWAWIVGGLILVGAVLGIALGGGDSDRGSAGNVATARPRSTPAPTAVPAAGKGLKVGMVSDVGGLDDASFNQNTWEGLERAANDFGVQAQFIESQAQADYEKNITEFAEQEYDLVFTVGFLLNDGTVKMAPLYPDVKFAGIDQWYDPPIPNATAITFNVDEAAFPIGYLAAGWAALKDPADPQVGYVGGMQIPPVEQYIVAYCTGADYYNAQKGTNVQCWGVYVGDFESPDKGRIAGKSLLDEGVDVIFGVGGTTGNGSLTAAKEAGKWGIGVDVDQYYTLPGARDILLTSCVKRLDNAVYAVVESLVRGRFAGGTIYVGTMANGGVGLAPYHDWDPHIPPDLQREVEAIQRGIGNGSIQTGWPP